MYVESEEIVNKVLDELGLSLDAQVSRAKRERARDRGRGS